ncbi:MAG TPA: NAD(P)H-binding protein [Pseudonocardiaceae bacterium]|jgi:uncharacterized protein YbjT (DUF2867 family)|nr:NAD(P)H-binding protein [Pseudonocardiaceae bacterium]
MIVVTGATGNIGRPLVRALAAAGERVTAVSRQAAELPDGVSHRRADLAEPESLRPALDNAEAMFLFPGGADPDGIVDVVEASGVRSVVLLSSLGAATRPQLYGQFRAYEDAVAQSGLEWTVLRPGLFDSNTFLWAETVRTQRTVFAPFGDLGLPAIDPADIGEVAAALLTAGEHVGKIYELTGPTPITPREQTAAISEALAAPVRFFEQSRAQAREQMLRFMPEPIVDASLAVLGGPSDAETAVSPEVQRILGRAPRSFAAWVARNIEPFR